MFQGKKVLITGGAGFIGSNLAICLINEGAQVTVVDSMTKDLGGNLFNLKPIESKIEILLKDMCDTSVQNKIDSADFIFDCAGNISHTESMENPLADLSQNVSSHLHLLERMKKKNRNAVLIYLSTRQVYGIPQYFPVDEKHPIQPIDVNGINKHTTEQYVQLYSKNYGLKTVSLRLTNTYGPRVLIRHSQQGFIGWFINRAILGETISLFGGGQQLRDISYVDDVTRAILLAASTPSCFGKVYNLSGDRCNLKSLAEKLNGLAGKGNIQSTPFPENRKKLDIGDYYSSSEAFKSETGWRPQIMVNAGLEHTVQFYLKNLKEYL